jgi:hypothetical protein
MAFSLARFSNNRVVLKKAAGVLHCPRFTYTSLLEALR